MVHKSLESLLLDQRLRRRRGWLSAEQRQRELEKLPDVSHKIGHSEDSPEEGAAGTNREGEVP